MNIKRYANKSRVRFRAGLTAGFLWLLFLLAGGNLSNLYAQTPGWIWAKHIGGISYSGGIATEANGNTYSVGYFTSASVVVGSTTLTNNGNGDVYVIKYDLNGNVLWAKSAGGTGLDRAVNAAVDAGGNVYVLGIFQSTSITFGTVTLNNTGGNNIFVVKYDPAGNVLWAVTTGGGTEAFGICTDRSGHVYVTGDYLFATNFGTVNLPHISSGKDFFIVQYDANTGNALWARGAGGSGHDIGYSVVTDNDGNAYVAGDVPSSSITFGFFTLNSFGGDDILVVKYDPLGNVAWAKRKGGSLFDYGRVIGSDTHNNIYVCGSFQSNSFAFGSGLLTNPNTANRNGYLLKFDSAGNELWGKSVGGADDDLAYGVTTDQNDNVYLAGYYRSTTLTSGTLSLNNTSSGQADLFILKYDANGNEQWAKSAVGLSNDMGSNITSDANDNLYMQGAFTSTPLAFDAINLNSSGSSDAFVAKLGCFPKTGFLGNDTTICSGAQLKLDAGGLGLGATGYTWSTGATDSVITVNSSDTYWVSLQGTSCPATDTITVTVNKVAVNLGQDTFICVGGSLTLSSSVSYNNPIYLWSTGAGTSSISVSQGGTYTLTVTDGGCSGKDDIIISVDTVKVNLGSDTTLCNQQSLRLQSSESYTNPAYRWSTNATTASIQVSQSGSYSLEVTEKGCTGSDTINVALLSTKVDLGNDTAICAGDSLRLQSSITYSNPAYNWNTGATTPSISTGSGGTYRLSVTDAGCTGMDSIHVDVNKTIVNLGIDTTLCNGTAATLGSSVPYTNPAYHWSTGASTATITVSESGYYGLTVTDKGCSGSDTVNVNISQLPDISIGRDTVLCNQQMLTLSVKPQQRDWTYQWSNGSTGSSTTVSSSGIYKVRVTDNYGCSVTDSMEVKYINLEQDLGEDQLLCKEDPVEVTLTARVPAEGASIVWSTGETTLQIEATDTGIYWVMVSSLPCAGSDTIKITTRQCHCKVYMPNAFTPNGDGLNDVFRPVLDMACPVVEYSFRVFNRWGQQVYYSAKPGEGWDGMILGEQAELGTYMYLVTYVIAMTGEHKLLKGDVTLIR